MRIGGNCSSSVYPFAGMAASTLGSNPLSCTILIQIKVGSNVKY